jgi:DNA repair protein RecO (recombination protein O)
VEFTERAIVLRLGGFREADLWLRLFSPGRGIFSAFAFGGSKSRRRFSGCLDLFNEALFHIKSSGQNFERGGYLTLQEGTLLRGPDRLRRDWRKLGVAINCSLFLESFCQDIGPDAGPGMGRASDSENDANDSPGRVIWASGAARSHALFVQLLNTLESDNPVSPLLPIFFRARLAFEQGYALNPRGCSFCGQIWQTDSQATLLLGEHGLICQSCAARVGYGARRFKLDAPGLTALRHILEQPLHTWHDMPVPEQGQKDCARAADAFLQFHTGLHWSHGRFRRG